MSGQREKREALSWQQAQALMRDLAEDVIGPILQDFADTGGFRARPTADVAQGSDAGARAPR